MPAPWISRHDHFEELPSTSTHLAQIWRSGEISPHETPIVITTDRQTAGRGRGDNRWYSDSGSLTFTLGIRPESFGLSLTNLVPIGLLTACAMIESIERLWPDAAGTLGVRWPNDIECDAGKIGGVLPECILQDSRGMLVLIGVGVNLTTNLGEGPTEARLIGASLAGVGCSTEVTKTDLLRVFLGGFPSYLQRLESQEHPWILEALKYDRLDGSRVQIKQGSELLGGVAQGWDASGRLLLRDESGRIVKISSGQVLRNLPPDFS